MNSVILEKVQSPKNKMKASSSLIQFLSDSCTIDDELLQSIDPKQSSHEFVIKSSNGTGTTT